MSDVLLVGINAKFIHTNLAIRSLRANAGEYKEKIELLEYTTNHRREEIFRGICERKPRVIGFSCYLWNIEYVTALVRDMKKVLPDVVIFAGGPEVSHCPEKVLEENPNLDFIMTGDRLSEKSDMTVHC